MLDGLAGCKERTSPHAGSSITCVTLTPLSRTMSSRRHVMSVVMGRVTRFRSRQTAGERKMDPMQLRACGPVRAIAAAALLPSAIACGGMSGRDPAASPRLGDGLRTPRQGGGGGPPAQDRGDRHEAIPGVTPAMTMPYEVEDAALLEGLVPGDRVRDTLRVDSRGFVVTALEKA